MANYINKDILCQAYIHIDPVPIDKKEYEQFKTYITEFIGIRGKFFLYEDVETDIQLKDGSLIVYVSILGAVYLAIGQYGSFRSGVDFLANDVKRLSEIIVSESLFQSKSRHRNIKHIEARIGVIGSLKKAVDDIDRVKEMFGKSKPDSVTKRINLLANEISKMISNLRDAKDIIYIKTNLLVQLNTIPSRPLARPKEVLSIEEIKFYQEEYKALLLTCQ